MVGTARIFVTIIMKWKDPRLAWEINEENCADYINVYTGRDQGETSISCCCCINQKQNKTNEYLVLYNTSENKNLTLITDSLSLSLSLTHTHTHTHTPLLHQKRHQFGSPILT
jgi:hypothetical protein